MQDCEISKKNKAFLLLKKTPPVGLEPTTFELEVQCADPLRHRGADVSRPTKRNSNHVGS